MFWRLLCFAAVIHGLIVFDADNYQDAWRREVDVTYANVNLTSTNATSANITSASIKKTTDVNFTSTNATSANFTNAPIKKTSGNLGTLVIIVVVTVIALVLIVSTFLYIAKRCKQPEVHTKTPINTNSAVPLGLGIVGDAMIAAEEDARASAKQTQATCKRSRQSAHAPKRAQGAHTDRASFGRVRKDKSLLRSATGPVRPPSSGSREATPGKLEKESSTKSMKSRNAHRVSTDDDVSSSGGIGPVVEDEDGDGRKTKNRTKARVTTMKSRLEEDGNEDKKRVRAVEKRPTERRQGLHGEAADGKES